jgi:hypothetical protein
MNPFWSPWLFRNKIILYLPLFLPDEFTTGTTVEIKIWEREIGQQDLASLPLSHAKGNLTLPGQFH